MQGLIMFGVIYKIINIFNKKVYIGQTTNLPNKRFKTHKADKTANCPKLFNAFNKYGRDNFSLKIISAASTRELLDYWEIFYIKKYNSIRAGYNIAEGGLGGGSPHSKKSKNKIGRSNSKALKGRKLSEAHKKNISDSLKGRFVSELTKKKISYSNKGRVSPMKGKTPSYETKRKISSALMNNTNSKGRALSTNHKEKISIANKGRKFSAEHKAHLSQVHRMFEATDESRICDLYKKLKSCLKVGEIFNCSDSTIRKVLKKNGIHLGRFTNDEELEICKRYEYSMSLTKVASLYGCSYGTISNVLKRNGVNISKLKNKREKDIILAYLKLGSYVKVAKIFGCSEWKVRNTINRRMNG